MGINKTVLKQNNFLPHHFTNSKICFSRIDSFMTKVLYNGLQ